MDSLECGSPCWTCHHIMRSHANLDCWNKAYTDSALCNKHWMFILKISILTSENPHNLKTMTTPFREHLREAEAAGTGDTASKRHLLALDEAAQACPGIEKHKYLNRNPGDTKRTL